MTASQTRHSASTADVDVEHVGSCLICTARAFNEAQVEIKRLRQGLWDCATAAGIDTDGDTTPDHLAFPDIVVWALNAVRELHEDYTAAILSRRDVGEGFKKATSELQRLKEEHGS